MVRITVISGDSTGYPRRETKMYSKQEAQKCYLCATLLFFPTRLDRWSQTDAKSSSSSIDGSNYHWLLSRFECQGKEQRCWSERERAEWLDKTRKDLCFLRLQSRMKRNSHRQGWILLLDYRTYNNLILFFRSHFSELERKKILTCLLHHSSSEQANEYFLGTVRTSISLLVLFVSCLLLWLRDETRLFIVVNAVFQQRIGFIRFEMNFFSKESACMTINKHCDNSLTSLLTTWSTNARRIWKRSLIPWISLTGEFSSRQTSDCCNGIFSAEKSKESPDLRQYGHVFSALIATFTDQRPVNFPLSVSRSWSLCCSVEVMQSSIKNRE